MLCHGADSLLHLLNERRNVFYEKAPDLPERHWGLSRLNPGHATKRGDRGGAAIMVITHANIIGTITPTR